MSRIIGVRDATVEDRAAILQIDRDSPTAAHWPEAKYTEAIQQGERRVLVAEESDKILGFLVAFTATAEWELENIAVLPSARRGGIGSTLLSALIIRAKTAGASEIRQEIRASNHPAQHLGQSLGFIQQGRRRDYYREPSEDALLLNYLVAEPRKDP